MLALPLWLTRLWEPCERLAEIAVKIRVNNEGDTYIATGHNYRGGGGGGGYVSLSYGMYYIPHDNDTLFY